MKHREARECRKIYENDHSYPGCLLWPAGIWICGDYIRRGYGVDRRIHAQCDCIYVLFKKGEPMNVILYLKRMIEGES